ncbi:MAG: LURP-one-related family protein [Actinomycetes bacterium]
MALLHHGKDGTRRFQMREKLLSVGDDYWIEDEDGEKVFKVDGKAVRFRETFVLEDAHGHEVATIKEKKLAVRDTMTIEIGGSEAKVHKRMLGIRDRYLVDFDKGDDFKAKGNFLDHEYEIEREGHKVAEISKKWFRVRETYGVEMDAEENVALILAITVCIDAMAREHD